VERPLVSSCALALIVALAPPAQVFGQQPAAQGQPQQAGQAQNSNGQNQSPNANGAQEQPQAAQPQNANNGANQPQGNQPSNTNPGQPQGNPPPNANNPQSQAQANPGANPSNGPSRTNLVFPNTGSRIVPVVNESQIPQLPQYRWLFTGQNPQPQNFAYYQAAQPQDLAFYWVDQASRNSGMSLAPADAALRAHLKLPEDQGLIVTAVEPGSPAAAVGIQPNDVLIRVAYDPKRSYNLAKPEDLEAALKNLDERPISIDLLRGGQKITAKVQPKIHATLGPVRPEPNPYRIGASVGPVEPALRAQLRLPEQQGLIVLEVEKDGPAAKSGVRQFDIFRKFDGVDLVDQASLTKLVQSRASRTVTVELLREGKPLEIKITPQLRHASLDVLTDPHAGGAWDLIFTNPGAASPNPNYAAFTPQTSARNLAYFQFNDVGAAGNAATNAKAQSAGDTALEKKIDDLSAQLKELRQAIDALAKSQANK
jgi:serine protease Do